MSPRIVARRDRRWNSAAPRDSILWTTNFSALLDYSFDVLWGEELRNGSGTGHCAEKAIDLLLIAAKGREHLLHFGRWRFEGCQIAGHLVHRQDRCVAAIRVIG